MFAHKQAGYTFGGRIGRPNNLPQFTTQSVLELRTGFEPAWSVNSPDYKTGPFNQLRHLSKINRVDAGPHLKTMLDHKL